MPPSTQPRSVSEKWTRILHGPSTPLSLLAAFSISVLATVTLISSPVSAATSSSVAVVRGVLDCSNELSTAGFAGSPSQLSMRSGEIGASVKYPRRLATPGSGSTFGQPEEEQYRFSVPIPSGTKSVTVKWALSCQDKDGNAAGTTSGQFSLANKFSPSHPATRDICNHHGSTGLVLTICNPALESRLGACAWEVFSAAVGGDALPVLSAVLDPPKGALQTAEAALGNVTGTLGGLILACAPIATSSPTPPTTTPTTKPTTGSGSGTWPVNRHDGSPGFFEYLGASLILPDWTSCDAKYCLAESSGTVYVFDSQLNQIGTIGVGVASPSNALLSLGVSSSDVQQLLSPTG